MIRLLTKAFCKRLALMLERAWTCLCDKCMSAGKRCSLYENFSHVCMWLINFQEQCGNCLYNYLPYHDDFRPATCNFDILSWFNHMHWLVTTICIRDFSSHDDQKRWSLLWLMEMALTSLEHWWPAVFVIDKNNGICAFQTRRCTKKENCECSSF